MQLRQWIAGAALAGLLSVPTVRSAEPVLPSSNITHVTLSGGRADVRREARAVALAPGDNRIVFELPATLLDGTVRASTRGGPGGRVVNVEVPEPGSEAAAPASDPRVAALQAEIAALDARLAGLTAGTEFLKAIRPDAPASGAAALDGTQLRTRLAFLVESVAANRDETDRINLAQSEKRAEVVRLREEMQRSSSGRVPRRAVVEIRADVPATLDVTLEYSVGGASWMPDYDVDVAEDFRSVRVGYFGALSQATGEDWDGVRVTLSTGHPATQFVLRALTPWRLSAPPPPLDPQLFLRGGRGREVASALSGQVMDSGRTSKVRAINTTEEAIATFIDPGSVWSASFEVAEPIDLPSDGSSRRMHIASIDLEADVRHEAVPACGDHAFLVAEATNTSDRPFLPGPTRVTLGEAFLGSGEMDQIAPAQKFRIALGVDPYVGVQREVVERSETLQGGRGRRISRDRIEIVNRRTRAIDVTLRDRIPVSVDREVEVRALKIEPEANPGEDGILEWKLSVPASGTARAEVGYEVRFPAGRRPGNL